MSANAIERLREQHLARDSASGKPRPDNCDTCADLAAVEALLAAARELLRLKDGQRDAEYAELKDPAWGDLREAVSRVETGQ